MRCLRSLSAAAVILCAGSSGAGAVEWRCYRNLAAFTERRAFTQYTGFECGAVLDPFLGIPIYPGHCGDWSHTRGKTWVDWIHGVSESCDDHDEGFMGPYDREWHGCSIDSGLAQILGPVQRSESLRWIGGVNRNWSAWPAELYEGYYGDEQLAALDGATVHMRNASAQLGDLDYCSHIQEFNWIQWGSFPVGVFIASGDPFDPGRGLLEVRAGGRADYTCSPEGDMCRPQYCSDLIVNISLTCEPVGGGYCGDGTCDSGEDPYSCWSDCPWWGY
jgi:hypothetical protein